MIKAPENTCASDVGIADEMSEIRLHANLAEVYFSVGATHKALEELTAIIHHRHCCCDSDDE